MIRQHGITMRQRTHSRGSCAYCQGKDVHGPLIAPNADLTFVGSEGDTVDLRLVRASPEFPNQLPGGGVPYSDQRPSGGCCSEQTARRRYGECAEGTLMGNDYGRRGFGRVRGWS